MTIETQTHAVSITPAAMPTPSEGRPLALAINDNERVVGTELLAREDVSLPRLVLVQAQHSDIPNNLQHVGEWYNTVTGEYHTQFSALVIAVAKQRVAFPREFSRDSEPVCGSDDAIQPRAEYLGTTVSDPKLGLDWVIQGLCAECPLSQFGPNGETPFCTFSFNYAMLGDDGIPFVMRAQRTGIAAARAMNLMVKSVGRRFMVRLTSKEVKGNEGTYREPVFSKAERTPPELLAFAAELGALGNLASRAEPDAKFDASASNGREGHYPDENDPSNWVKDDDIPF